MVWYRHTSWWHSPEAALRTVRWWLRWLRPSHTSCYLCCCSDMNKRNRRSKWVCWARRMSCLLGEQPLSARGFCASVQSCRAQMSCLFTFQYRIVILQFSFIQAWKWVIPPTAPTRFAWNLCRQAEADAAWRSHRYCSGSCTSTWLIPSIRI